MHDWRLNISCEKIWNIFWREIIYVLVCSIYLWNLNNLNTKLLQLFNENDYIDIISYNNNLPIYYFVIMIFLTVIGVTIIVYRFRQMRYQNLDKENIIINLISICLIAIFIILLFLFINNPILKAIFVIVTIGSIIFGVNQ